MIFIRHNTIRIFIIVLLIFSSMVVFAQPVYACSPTETPADITPTADTLEGRIQQTPVIFEGTVTAISNDRQLTTIRVVRYFKGDGPVTVTVLGFGWGPDCLPVTDIGQRGVFYTIGDPNRQLSLQPWSEIDFASDTRIEEIERLVGHKPVVFPTLFVKTIPVLPEAVVREANIPDFIPLIGFGALLAVIAVMIRTKRN